MDEPVIVVRGETEAFASQITAEDPDPGLEMLIETREVKMQLQRLPEPEFGLVRIAGANQHIQRCAMLFEQIGGDVAADVAGRAGQEYRHVAPLVPVLTATPLSASAG